MPVAYQVILTFGPAEFFMLALFGLTAISAVSAKSIVKGLIGGGLGVLVSTIGFHRIAGQARFTFGTMFLQDGVGMISGVLGLLAMSMAIKLWMEGSSIVSEGVPLTGSIKEGIAAVFRNFSLFVRTCLMAWVIGVAPGAGSAVAGFVCYASAAKSCKNPENFGKGDIRGVIAGDTAIHACSGGDLLPTVTLGIPGSGGMAVLLGAFAMHGVAPGPTIIKFHIDVIYVIVYTLFIAHVASVIMSVGTLPIYGEVNEGAGGGDRAADYCLCASSAPT